MQRHAAPQTLGQGAAGLFNSERFARMQSRTWGMMGWSPCAGGESATATLLLSGLLGAHLNRASMGDWVLPVEAPAIAVQ